MYAIVDKDDELKIGIKSTAIFLNARWIYFVGLAVAAGLFVYQQTLIVNRDKVLCFKAFLNNNWFGLVVFVGLALDYLQ